MSPYVVKHHSGDDQFNYFEGQTPTDGLLILHDLWQH